MAEDKQLDYPLRSRIGVDDEDMEQDQEVPYQMKGDDKEPDQVIPNQGQVDHLNQMLCNLKYQVQKINAWTLDRPEVLNQYAYDQLQEISQLILAVLQHHIQPNQASSSGS